MPQLFQMLKKAVESKFIREKWRLGFHAGYRSEAAPPLPELLTEPESPLFPYNTQLAPEIWRANRGSTFVNCRAGLGRRIPAERPVQKALVISRGGGACLTSILSQNTIERHVEKTEMKKRDRVYRDIISREP